MKIIHKQCPQQTGYVDTFMELDDGTERLIRCENQKIDYRTDFEKQDKRGRC